ncbi:nucleotide exchange factor GrpE [Staphylococcus sp. 18_1_E_LY]|uniref:Protein GrpE n=1 Tax=Staphylococcus lloydii TaxID=2781774 RepID=A0A7T1AXK9_9STAP|nr:nucleotide exchange factor GrpE [Staphylococcus lloydii]MBF7018564.1 nucleotide exchange factor GrpE [Staphylococcus lloydii]MBF7026292.1 nucleotide exchange factor GrpE [Staphylococcus lloydii]QPM73969.1 nucleotide exchange factor GrpE [Staphylococcus lloydii]
MTENNESVSNNQETEAETSQTANQNHENDSAASVAEEQTQDANDNLQDNETETTENEAEQVDPKDAEIEKLQQEVQQNEEKYLRLYAEFENYKRRIQKENQTMKEYQAQSVLNDILPTIDNIERALQIDGEDEQFVSLKKGVQMVYDSLLKALQDNGLERIESEGQQFDPNFHQAVMQDNNDEFETGQVTQELQTGYKLKDRVLRPSMVKVNE